MFNYYNYCKCDEINEKKNIKNISKKYSVKNSENFCFFYSIRDLEIPELHNLVFHLFTISKTNFRNVDK